MGVFNLVEETREQVVVEVNAKDPLTVAKHPYVTAQMRYVTVTRGEDNVFTIVNDDGSTWSCYEGLSGYTVVSENVRRLKEELKSFLKSEHVFLDVNSDLNPYAAKFYKWRIMDGPERWWVDFKFADTKKEARAYFPPHWTPQELVNNEFVKYNELFKGQGKHVREVPNGNVGVVYEAEIAKEW